MIDATLGSNSRGDVAGMLDRVGFSAVWGDPRGVFGV